MNSWLLFPDDPVNIFAFLDQCPNSILKFFEDIFSSHSTSGIFFKNDLMVLIDIVLRKANDLQPGDKVSNSANKEMKAILMDHNYCCILLKFVWFICPIIILSNAIFKVV